MRYKFTIHIALLALLVLAYSCNQNSENSTAGTNPNVAQNFTLDSLTEDKELSLEDLRGKAVVLNFWATWCTPCREEMPLFEQTWNKYKDNEVVFLGVDVMDDQSNAQDFLKSIGITYPNLYDPEGNVSRKYNVIALPATFFIDREGNIISKNYGPFLGEDGMTVLQSNVEELIK